MLLFFMGEWTECDRRMRDFAQWVYEGFYTMGGKTVGLFPVLVRGDKPEQSPAGGEEMIRFFSGGCGCRVCFRFGLRGNSWRFCVVVSG